MVFGFARLFGGPRQLNDFQKTNMTVPSKYRKKTWARSRRPTRPFKSLKRSYAAPSREEIKNYDWQNTLTPTTGAPSIVNATVFIPVLGSGNYNRTGTRCRLKYLDLTYAINTNQSGGQAQPQIDQFRVSVVYDRQPNGSYPAYTDIFEDVTSTGGALASSALNKVNIGNKERFVVLHDVCHALPPCGVGGVLDLSVGTYQTRALEVHKKHINLKNMETHFKNVSVAGNYTDVLTGALLIVIFQESPTTTGTYEIVFDTRTAFTDV